MNFKLGMSALVLGLSVFACTADSAEDPADAEEASATESDIIANAQKVAGAFTVESGGASPTFDGLVLEANGTFFADVDTGIRCFRAPCPSNVRVTGKFSATKSTIRFSPNAGQPSTEYHGRYSYTLKGESLSLSRSNNGFKWSEQLSKANSYCAAPVDCESQALIHPMCVGSWTCGQAESNQCGYKCGGVPVPAALIPADATKVVASSPGGGFRPAAPAGSTCNGSQKYTYDIAAKTVAFEECGALSAGKPYTIQTGSKVLTTKELKAVQAALAGLAVSTGDICGADKPWLSIDVSAPSGDKTLVDEFYSCRGGNDTYVSGIDAVFAALRDGAH